MKVTKNTFGYLNEGKEVFLFTLKDKFIEVKATNYGGIITSIKNHDKGGNLSNIVLGFDSLNDYLSKYYQENNPYFGCIVGRYANRIAKGKFNLNGTMYQLPVNNEENHLHGGIKGFHTKLWEAKILENENYAGIEFACTSPDMEEGYPGNLSVRVQYLLNNTGELIIHFFAETDKPTIVNLTNHTYFNLKDNKGDILDHKLLIYSDKFTENKNRIPTGRIVSSKNSPFDFTSIKKIGTDIEKLPDGYDLNYVIENNSGDLKQVAELNEETSGRKVEIYSTQHGLQLYTGYFIPEFNINGEIVFGKYSGVALEPQNYPDAPNQPGFPSSVLLPGEKYQHTMMYRFGLIKSVRQ